MYSWGMKRALVGFTLIEMLVAVAIGSIVLLALFFALNTTINTSIRVREIQQRIRSEQLFNEAINQNLSLPIVRIRYQSTPFELKLQNGEYEHQYFLEENSLIQVITNNQQIIAKNTLLNRCQNIKISFIGTEHQIVTLNHLKQKNTGQYKGILFAIKTPSYTLFKTKAFKT